MAVVAGTQLRYDVVGDREALADAIYRISPEETPIMSSMRRDSAKNTYTEWQTDTLAAASTSNALLDGGDAIYTVPQATVRVGNVQQISGKTVRTSGTLMELDLAGRRTEEALQQAKRAAELKLDMEKIILNNQAANFGGEAVARTLAGLPVWLQTNTAIGSGGANSGHVSGAPTVTRTDGTKGAFTKAMLDSVMQSMWTNGGKPRVLYVGPYNKTVVSGFDGMASFTTHVNSPAPSHIVSAADVYVNDFGKVRVVPSRQIRERDAFVIDPAMLALCYYRNFRVEALAKTGDSKQKQLLVEYTLKVLQEAGLGGIFDLDESLGDPA